MARWISVLVGAALVFAVSSATAQLVVARTVFGSRVVRPGETASLTIACPRRSAAVSAGLAAPAGTTLLSARPAGPRAYSFRLGATAGSGVHRATAGVACRRIPAGAPVLRVRAVTRRLRVPGGGVRSGTLGCPGRMLPAGASADLAPHAGAPALRAGLTVRRSLADLRGFAFTVANASARARDAVLYGNCVTVVRRAGTPGGPLRVKITTFTEPVAPGLQRAVHRCEPGWFSLGVGFAVPSGAQRLGGAIALAGGGRWWVESARAATVRLQLTCGRLVG